MQVQKLPMLLQPDFSIFTSLYHGEGCFCESQRVHILRVAENQTPHVTSYHCENSFEDKGTCSKSDLQASPPLTTSELMVGASFGKWTADLT